MIVRDVLGNTLTEGDVVSVSLGTDLAPGKIVKIETGDILVGGNLRPEGVDAQQVQPYVLVQVVVQRPVVPGQGIALGLVKAAKP